MTRSLAATARLTLAALGVVISMVVASGPAQAAEPTHAGVGTAFHATYYCTSYHSRSNATAWGFINIGYFEIDVGVCYNNWNGYWQPQIVWGPYCSSGWNVPWIRTTAVNACYGWTGTGYGGVYGMWTAQAFIIPIGWCCDRQFTYSYGL